MGRLENGIVLYRGDGCLTWLMVHLFVQTRSYHVIPFVAGRPSYLKCFVVARGQRITLAANSKESRNNWVMADHIQGWSL
jgi:hypothetical protein